MFDQQPCSGSCSNNELIVKQWVKPFQDPSPSDAKGDIDQDKINDANESKFHTLPGGIGFYLYPPGKMVPDTRDIFIEVDYMYSSTTGWSCQLPSLSKLLVITAFMKEGIHLHVDDGDMGGGQTIPDDLETSVEEFNGNVQFGDPNGNHLYGNYFSDDRVGVFHYAVIANHYQGDLILQSTFGVTPRILSDGFMVFISTIRNVCHFIHGNEYNIAKSFIHELGHGLGLYHPPNNDALWKNRDTSMYQGLFELVNYSHHRNIDGVDEWANISLILSLPNP